MRRAVRLDAPRRLCVVPAEPAEPAAGEALIRVAWAGICGSDLELFRGRRPAAYARYPIVPGHEWSGTVEDVGPGVDPALVGKPVVGEGFRSCQMCSACHRGEPTICQAGYDETGFTRNGAWADHLTIPARLLHQLPVTADLRAAAALEPAACAAEACLKAAVQPCERVAVIGGGTLGLLATQLLRATSPTELLVVDVNRSRATIAARCGATALVTPEDIGGLTEPFDVVVEAAGATGTAATATRLVRRGGRVVLVGIPDDADQISTRQLITKQVTVSTVFGAPPRAWVYAVRAFTAGVLDPSRLVTHEFALEETAEALRILGDRDSGAVKVLLRPQRQHAHGGGDFRPSATYPTTVDERGER